MKLIIISASRCLLSIIVIFVTITLLSEISDAVLRRKSRKTRESTSGSASMKDIIAPLLSDEIDLETIEGIEQVTKLILIKTDSLPVDSSNEKIDARYLNGLMETLYTGLRKPFKSVSADILGIFPSFEEKQVRCDSVNGYDDDIVRIKREYGHDNVEFVSPGFSSMTNRTSVEADLTSSINSEDTISSNSITKEREYKSSVQVCKAVTSDCLSMEDLVQVLPPSINTFDKVVVRICPIMLFRIMNNICHTSTSVATGGGTKSTSNDVKSYHLPIDVDNGSQKRMGLIQPPTNNISTSNHYSGSDKNKSSHHNASFFLNNLLREKEILKNDELAAKRPQKLHKKSRTQANYNKGKGVTPLQHQGTVDEQLQRVRLILTEPSIEKVWIFSLMFVMISIVVSMGGLIVLPFVKKTTRRRILTLFEGLAVGGLAGSATLHMFPQAFGLVNEHYDKYFWRIFMVFAGIYICYLCERMLKIFKVMRAKLRRSQASLNDMDNMCYGFSYGLGSGTGPSSFHSIRAKRSSGKAAEFSSVYSSKSKHVNQSYHHNQSKLSKDRLDQDSMTTQSIDNVYNSTDYGFDHMNTKSKKLMRNPSHKSSRTRSNAKNNLDTNPYTSKTTKNSEMNPMDVNQTNLARQKLVRCLQSVQNQFSRVYAVQSTDADSTQIANQNKSEYRGYKGNQSWSFEKGNIIKQSPRRNSIFKGWGKFIKIKNKSDKTSSSHKPNLTNKIRDDDYIGHRRTSMNHVRTARNPMARQNHDLGRGYLQHRLSRVGNVATDRQDQDNAARMSVDTVAWMIVFGDAVLNVIDGLSIGAAFERNILAGISISVAVMLEEVTHRLGTFAVLIRAGMSMKQSLLWTFLSACALFPGLVAGIMLSDATEDATPYIFCAAGGIFLYMALVDVMKEMNRSIENAMRKDLKSTLQIFALQNLGIMLAVIFLSFLALYEQAMDFEEYQQKYKHLERNS